MPSLDMIAQIGGSYGPFIAIAIATFVAAEALFLMIARKRGQVGAINSRLRVLDATEDRQAALIELRRKRGLTADGSYRLPVEFVNRLLLQSGLRMSPGLLLLVTSMPALATGFVGQLLLPFELAVALACLIGLALPLLILVTMRRRRLKRLEEQLPEAVDVMVRSLRAGHPIPVAIAMVGRELADPIGSEFGMVSDEMTYGLDLTMAMSNLRARSGQSDIALLVVAISIQAKTGGNLAELLANLARMIRERARMRRKIQSLSAEGRMSAVALSCVPVFVFLVVTLMAPTYYGDVRGDSMFMPAVYTGLALWITGVVAIRRLVNFKI